MSANATLQRSAGRADDGTERSERTPERTPEQKVERLNTASLKRHLEPEEMFDWTELGDGQLLPDELIAAVQAGYDLTPEQKAAISREEVASMLSAGVRFEAVLMAGFSMWIATAADLRDPRLVYALHEIGEETRHSRAFLRIIDAIGPQARNPLDRGPVAWGRNKVMKMMLSQPALLTVFVLAGEEIPDLLQKRASEHPDTDPLLAEVNRYHRQEEARHLAYARLVLPELAGRTGRLERFRIRHSAPFGIRALFDGMLHPGIYASVGLPQWKAWRKANGSPHRVGLRHEATRNVLRQVIDAGFIDEARVPRTWQRLCGVDRKNRPVGLAT